MTLCACGCGKETKPAPWKIKQYGYEKGDPRRFVAGHANKGKIRIPFAKRVERNTIPEPNSGCLLWIGPVTRNGYGSMGTVNKGRAYVHRFVWEEANGPIPSGMNVLHSCDQPCCVRLDHLSLGTASDNGADMARKNRGGSHGPLPYGVRITKGSIWSAVRLRGTNHYLGVFDTVEKAGRAAQEKKAELLASFGWPRCQ